MLIWGGEGGGKNVDLPSVFFSIRKCKMKNVKKSEIWIFDKLRLPK